jgi:hypothetical protein
MAMGCNQPRIYRGARHADGTAYIQTLLCGTDGRLCYTCFTNLMNDLRQDIRLDTRPSVRRKVNKDGKF